jgi:hypothetical protein
MNALIPDTVELEPVPDAAKASEAVVAELNSASTLKTIPGRESTLTPVMERILRFRPTSHWGINE